MHKRGQGRCAGRIPCAFRRPVRRGNTTRDVGTFLRELDDEGLTPRNVNKHRQPLGDLRLRADSFALAANPVVGTDKRRELPAAALDFYEPGEVEALARAAADGRHRTNGVDVGDDELALHCAAPRTLRTPNSSASLPTPVCGSARRSRCAGATLTSRSGG